jgi:hypothetical protein
LLLKSKGGFLRLDVDSNGEFATNTEFANFQKSIEANAALKFLWLKDLYIPIPGGKSDLEKRPYIYPFGVRVAPLGLETDQDFSLVDGTVKAQGVATIPYIFDYVVLSWHYLAGVNRVFLPPYLYGGYTYVYKVKGVTANGESETENRVDAGFEWNVPLATTIDLAVKYAGFYLTGAEAYEDLVDIRMKLYFDKARKIGGEVGYQKGATPPVFEETETILAGLAVTMF